ncbi:MAG: HNH endonuclease [Holophagaceae bacterium]|nr:HNH endonuclease [Holophagaceae bacterium]
MTQSVNTIKSVCDLLITGHHNDAKCILNSEYPFSYVKPNKRAYTPKECMDVFVRDGFIDRYSGARLIFPGTLRLIHKVIPSEFPFHTNWKMSKTHIAFWELSPTIDHVVPVARGGQDVIENWVATSQLRNSSKSNWLLEELGWQLLPPGDISNWDGLTSWFMEYITSNPEHLTDSYIRTWHKTVLTHPRPSLRSSQTQQ